MQFKMEEVSLISKHNIIIELHKSIYNRHIAAPHIIIAAKPAAAFGGLPCSGWLMPAYHMPKACTDTSCWALASLHTSELWQ